MPRLNPAKIQRILVISLSNIGDVILTFPVLDILREDFPRAKISVVVGPKAEPLLQENPHFEQTLVFHKRQFFLKHIHFMWQLKKEHFDLIVDLRNTAIPFFIGCRYRTSFFDHQRSSVHMRLRHLNRLKTIYPFLFEAKRKYSLFISDKNSQYVNGLLTQEVDGQKPLIVLAPGAANSDKRWTEKGYAQVCDYLIKTKGGNIIFVGDEQDKQIVQNIQEGMALPSVNFCGRLTLLQLGELLKKASLVISSDSAPMHLASYLNCPVLAIFGPSDPQKYGPWGEHNYYFRKNQNCLKCQNGKSAARHTCMEAVKSEDVVRILELLHQKGLLNK